MQAIIKTVDMSDEMEKDAIAIAIEALFEYNVESQVAAHIKREFDKKYRYGALAKKFSARLLFPALGMCS